MLQISQFFWRMCLLNAGPEHLPSSRFAVTSVLGTYVLTMLIVATIIRPAQPFNQTIAITIIGLVLQIAVTYLLLLLKSHADRFIATWMALLGTSVIINLLLLPFNIILLNTDNQGLAIFAESSTIICVLWWFVIAGHIYHRAVQISILQGFALAMVTEIVGVAITFELFPRNL